MIKNIPLDLLKGYKRETDSFLEKCDETLRSASNTSGQGKQFRTSSGFQKPSHKENDSFSPIFSMDYSQMISKRRSNRNENIQLQKQHNTIKEKLNKLVQIHRQDVSAPCYKESEEGYGRRLKPIKIAFATAVTGNHMATYGMPYTMPFKIPSKNDDHSVGTNFFGVLQG